MKIICPFAFIREAGHERNTASSGKTRRSIPDARFFRKPRGHLDETLSGRTGKIAIFGFSRNVALNEEVARFGQDRGRAAPAQAELRQFAHFSDDFLNFIWFLWREPK